MTYFSFSAEVIRPEPGGDAFINSMNAEISEAPRPLRIADVSREYSFYPDDYAEDEVYWVEFSLLDSPDELEPIFEFAPALGVDPLDFAMLCDEVIGMFDEHAANDND